jgi:sulfate adenylyltransferase
MNGGYSPLNGFMNEKDYVSVLKKMHIENGNFFPLPVNLYINQKQYEEIKNESNIILKDEQGFSLAEIKIDDIYDPDYDLECELAYGTKD